MKTNLKTVFSALGALPLYFLAIACEAQEIERACCAPVPRWYVGVNGSLTLLRDVDFENTSSNAALTRTDTVTYKRGLGISGAAGYRFLDGVRGEIEIARRSSDVDKFPPGVATDNTKKRGAQVSTAIMTNFYVDAHNDTDYTPYIGAGVGLANVRAPIYYTLIDVGTGQILETRTLKEWTMAYQLMLGVAYHVHTSVTPFDINFGYRYFSGKDIDTRKFRSIPSRVSYSNDSHNLEFGGHIYF